MSTESLLDIKQAADRLGTPTRFIRRLVAERRIPFYKIGRYIRIDTKDLELFIEHGRVVDRQSQQPMATIKQGPRTAASPSVTLFDL